MVAVDIPRNICRKQVNVNLVPTIIANPQPSEHWISRFGDICPDCIGCSLESYCQAINEMAEQIRQLTEQVNNCTRVVNDNLL